MLSLLHEGEGAQRTDEGEILQTNTIGRQENSWLNHLSAQEI